MKRAVLIAAALTSALLTAAVALAGPALAATGSPASPDNLSDNPVLATNANGWSIREGGSAVTRVAVSTHVTASFAAKTVSNKAVTRLYLPTEPVTPTAQAWTFAADVQASRAGATASASVEWFTASGAWISAVEGSFVPLGATTWTRAFVSAVPPAGAASARTNVNVSGSAKNATVQVTQHDVRAPIVAPPTTTAAPPTTTTAPPPPPPEAVFVGDFETGNFDQWPMCQSKFWNNPCPGMPANYALSIEPGHQGNYAGRFEVRDGDMPFCCGERAQVVNETAAPLETEGKDLWYTWSYMIDQQYPLSNSWQLLFQWHSDVDGSPPLAFETIGSDLVLQTRPRPNAPYTGITEVWRTPYVKGQWVDMKIHVKWSADPNTGFVELWQNGVKQTFVATPPENGGTVACQGATLCHFSNIYPGDLGNRMMATYYRDPAIVETGVVHHDNIAITTQEP